MRLLILLAALIAGACAPVPSTPAAGEGAPVQGAGPEDLAEARARWEDAGANDYAFTIRRSCFCPPEYSGPFRTTVRSGAVTEATREGRRVDAAQLQIPTIPELFQQIDDAYVNGAATVRVSYDAAAGYPVDVWIDQDEAMADEEIGYTVSDVVAQ